jgi:hypothetical protein
MNRNSQSPNFLAEVISRFGSLRSLTPAFDLEWMNGHYALQEEPGIQVYFGSNTGDHPTAVEIGTTPTDVLDGINKSVSPKQQDLTTDDEETRNVEQTLSSIHEDLSLRHSLDEVRPFISEFKHYCITGSFDNSSRAYLMEQDVFCVLRFENEKLHSVLLAHFPAVVANCAHGEWCFPMSFFEGLNIFWEGPADGSFIECSDSFDRPPWP